MVKVQQPLGFQNSQAGFSHFWVLLERGQGHPNNMMSCNAFVFHRAIGCEMSSTEGQGLLHPKHTWASGTEATTKNWLWSTVQAASSWSKWEWEGSWASWCCWQMYPSVSIKSLYLLCMAPGPDTHPNSLLTLHGLRYHQRPCRDRSARHLQAFGDESSDNIESFSLETLTQRMKPPLHIIPSEKGLTLQISQLWPTVGPAFPVQPEMCAQDVDEKQVAKLSQEDISTMLINIVLSLRKDAFAKNLSM